MADWGRLTVAVAGFFVEVDAGGEVEGVDKEAEDDEGGGLEGRGAFT